MTSYYAVVLDGASLKLTSFATMDEAEAYDVDRLTEGYSSKTVGEIDGDAYLVIYTRPKKAVKRVRGCRDTTHGEKGPQTATEAHGTDGHQCEGCGKCRGRA